MYEVICLVDEEGFLILQVSVFDPPLDLIIAIPLSLR